MEIKQIFIIQKEANQSTIIYGLGVDNKMYWWDVAKAVWTPHWNNYAKTGMGEDSY